MKEIIFFGDGRDFHARDWYITIKEVCSPRIVMLATDLIESEGRPLLIEKDDLLIKLFNIDFLLFKGVSFSANIWRNIVKVLVVPLQIPRIKKIFKDYPHAIFHAHTMYYMFLCWIANVPYIGTPQGSEILVRPYRSKLYMYFAKKTLAAANHIIIDSINLQKGIYKLCKKQSIVIQNGIDVEEIEKNINRFNSRKYITSIRGLYPNYRIDKIFEARDHCSNFYPLLLFYPFFEKGYLNIIYNKIKSKDINLGRIATKGEMYKLLGSTLLAISIPESDSSPRSVYESVFCGCCVAVTYNTWIESLPECMLSRIVVVDLEDNLWLEKAIEKAKKITKKPFNPTEEALNLFDQKRSMKLVADLFY